MPPSLAQGPPRGIGAAGPAHPDSRTACSAKVAKSDVTAGISHIMPPWVGAWPLTRCTELPLPRVSHPVPTKQHTAESHSRRPERGESQWRALVRQ